MNFSDGSPLQHFFYLSFTNHAPSRLIIGWEGSFDCKGFECNEILHHFTMSKSVRSCVIFIQALTKCFSLPANGTTGMFFGKNNLFINGWTFLDSQWTGFSGFKSMLKKFYSYTYHISVWRPEWCSYTEYYSV